MPRELAVAWESMCPAKVYEIDDDAPQNGTVTVRVNASNCVQCGAITAKGGRLTPPEGGSGPEYTVTVSTRASHPAAQGLLGWIQANSDRLRELLDEEAAGSDDLAPAGDPSVRAHLRLVAEALAACAAPASRERLEAFSAELPALLEACGPRLDDEPAAGGRGHGLRAGPAVRGRRVRRPQRADDGRPAACGSPPGRASSWTALDEARLPADPVAGAVLAWMGDRQAQLADTIFAMDRRAKEGEMARGGPDAVANPEVVNRIGQAAMLQAHTRFLVEALGETL